VTGGVEALALVPPWAVLLAVFGLPALEASTLLGLVVPGEIAVLLGGVLAHQGKVPLVAVMAAAAAGAIAGDSIGYLLGARLGPALFSHASERVARRIEAARAFVRRFGAPAVLLGRWAAFLRALVPSIAGASGVAYRRFAAYNVAGGTLWGVAVAGIGFLAGAAYGRAERSLGLAGTLGALVLVVGVVLGSRHVRSDGVCSEQEPVGDRAGDDRQPVGEEPERQDTGHCWGERDPDEVEPCGERGLDGAESAGGGAGGGSGRPGEVHRGDAEQRDVGVKACRDAATVRM
jgi:membrane-associated protein